MQSVQYLLKIIDCLRATINRQVWKRTGIQVKILSFSTKFQGEKLIPAKYLPYFPHNEKQFVPVRQTNLKPHFAISGAVSKRMNSAKIWTVIRLPYLFNLRTDILFKSKANIVWITITVGKFFGWFFYTVLRNNFPAYKQGCLLGYNIQIIKLIPHQKNQANRILYLWNGPYLIHYLITIEIFYKKYFSNDFLQNLFNFVINLYIVNKVLPDINQPQWHIIMHFRL